MGPVWSWDPREREGERSRSSVGVGVVGRRVWALTHDGRTLSPARTNQIGRHSLFSFALNPYGQTERRQPASFSVGGRRGELAGMDARAGLAPLSLAFLASSRTTPERRWPTALSEHGDARAEKGEEEGRKQTGRSRAQVNMRVGLRRRRMKGPPAKGVLPGEAQSLQAGRAKERRRKRVQAGGACPQTTTSLEEPSAAHRRPSQLPSLSHQLSSGAAPQSASPPVHVIR